ncbi:MAG: TraR/DksA family transcriptional regulator [Rhodobacteraceae bacterium]|nr:TraR/DksA family transcriptional regulator [Paracoccaceae bacterium]
MTPVQERKRQLETRRRTLRARLERIEGELDTQDSRDWEDRAIEREDDEVLEGIGLAAQRELRMVEAALERVATGEYGLCVRCGEAIAEERLDLLPHTPFCQRCAP